MWESVRGCLTACESVSGSVGERVRACLRACGGCVRASESVRECESECVFEYVRVFESASEGFRVFESVF